MVSKLMVYILALSTMCDHGSGHYSTSEDAANVMVSPYP